MHVNTIDDAIEHLDAIIQQTLKKIATLTRGANYKTTATLATGIVSGKVFTVSFVCVDGTNWYETSRTTAM